jgi:hypothetical protein
MGYPHFSIDCADHHRLVADSGPFVEVLDERHRQDAIWGEQNHVDGTGVAGARTLADKIKTLCAQQHADGHDTWAVILAEEIAEALCETDPQRLRTELVQSAAVIMAWLQAMDRRPAEVAR